MRIDGAGGCFDNRIYEINNKSAWNLLLLTVNEMGVTVDSRDDEMAFLNAIMIKRLCVFRHRRWTKKLLRFLLMFMVRGFRFITGSHRIKKSIFFTTYLKTSCVNTGPLSFVPAVRPKSVRL